MIGYPIQRQELGLFLIHQWKLPEEDAANLQYSDGQHREFPFTRNDFEKVCRLIYNQAGISLKLTKQHMVYSRLALRIRATNKKSFNDYLTLLEDPESTEWESFVNALTTNLTSFFREPHHFPILAEHVLPLQKKRLVSLWCAACSTGEEAYSMAMTLVEAYGGFQPNISIIATDVDTNVLATAAEGVYPADRVKKLSSSIVKKFFLQGTGSRSGYVKVRPELRSMVTFSQVNLLGDNWPITSPLDAIFCRNVMIYFDKETQLRILKNFAPLLQPEGLFFAGHSENFYNALHLFKLRGQTVYELVNPEHPKIKKVP